MTDNLIEFDVTKAKAGWPVVTRDGRTVRIVSFDMVSEDNPIVAIFKNNYDECEHVDTFNVDGSYLPGEVNEIDLFLKPKTNKLWINVYKYSDNSYYGTSNLFETKEMAICVAGHTNSNYIGTYAIEVDDK